MLQLDEDRRKRLIEQAVAALPSDNEADLLADYTRILFAYGAQEDLEAYSPADLAAIAADSFAFSRERLAGVHKLRVVNPDPEMSGSARADVTVIECVNDNMPFLLDSVLAELAEIGVDIKLVLHPIEAVARDAAGMRIALFEEADEAGKGALEESVIHIHIARIDSDLRRKELHGALDRVFLDVRRCVDDWTAMRDRLNAAIDDYRTTPPPIAEEEISEAIAFLEWIADDNFILLGMRNYAFVGTDADGRLERVEDSNGAGLGLLRDPEVKVLRRGREFVTYTPELREFLMLPVPLIVTKANVKSTVHRRAHLDYIGAKTFDTTGKLVGELRIVGLFTAGAYNRSVKSIPLLRRKAALTMEQSGYDHDSHSGRLLLNVLEQFPRDELIQIDQDTLTDWAQEIMLLSERPRIRVLARADRFDRFVSVLVFVPRDRYNTASRIAIGDYLAKEFHGRVSAFYPSYPEGSLARVHFIIGRYEGEDAGTEPGGARSPGRRSGAHLGRRSRGCAVGRIRPAQGRRDLRPLPPCLSAGLSGHLFRRRDPVGHSPHRNARRVPTHRDRGLPAEMGYGARYAVRPESVSSRPLDPAVRARADPGKHGSPGDQ